MAHILYLFTLLVMGIWDCLLLMDPLLFGMLLKSWRQTNLILPILCLMLFSKCTNWTTCDPTTLWERRHWHWLWTSSLQWLDGHDWDEQWHWTLMFERSRSTSVSNSCNKHRAWKWTRRHLWNQSLSNHGHKLVKIRSWFSHWSKWLYEGIAYSGGTTWWSAELFDAI